MMFLFKYIYFPNGVFYLLHDSNNSQKPVIITINLFYAFPAR